MEDEIKSRRLVSCKGLDCEELIYVSDEHGLCKKCFRKYEERKKELEKQQRKLEKEQKKREKDQRKQQMTKGKILLKTNTPSESEAESVICKICGVLFERDYKYRTRVCRDCSNKKQMNRYNEGRNNPEKYFRRILSAIKKRKNKGDLTLEQLMALYEEQDGLCALSGIPMEIGSKRNDSGVISPYSISIDRIDNSLPYTIENIWLICMSLNQFKSSYELGDIYDIIKKVCKTNSLLPIVEEF